MRKKARMWREDDDAKLRKMREEGYSNAYIAVELDRAYSSVTGRVRRLGLDVRRSGTRQVHDAKTNAAELLKVIRALAHSCVKCPSNRQLAERAGITTSQMMYALKHLCNSGDIEIEYTDDFKRRIVTENGDATAWNAYLSNDLETSPRHRVPPVKIERKCLSCGGMFHSPHAVALHRICETCIKLDAYVGGNIESMYA